jgi:uncharacterized ferritin-like protein (DUF455 family)
MKMELRQTALLAWQADSPAEKSLLVETICAARDRQQLQVLPDHVLILGAQPGRPEKPSLVHPRELTKRSGKDDAARAALLHAIAHIEFNAINLALDAICRYPCMPTDYYLDWLKVAQEESKHFNMLQNRLKQLGYSYGDFVAHNGLWEIAMRSAARLLDRMAMVPRMLEARGLDVTPGMIARLQHQGDAESAAILQIILAEEIGHVEIGTRWFRYLCAQDNRDPESTWLGLVRDYLGDKVLCPLEWDLRQQAGFSERELEGLEALCRHADTTRA